MSKANYKHRIKIGLTFLSLLILGFLLWKGLGRNPHLLPSTLIDKPFPQFSEQNLFLSKGDITSDIFKGHITLLNVFATWCVSCQAEHSVLKEIAASQQVELVGLNYKDKRENTLAWLKQRGNPYREIIFDSEGKLAIDLGVYGTPESYLIDREGRVRYRHVGPLSPDDWENAMLPLVRKI